MSVHVQELESSVEVEPDYGAGASGAPVPDAAPAALELEHRRIHRQLARDSARTYAEGYAD